MDMIAQKKKENKRYLPHELSTKINSVKLYEDLQIQMKRYLWRSNRIPMSVLGWKSPIQKRQELEAARFC